MVRAAAHAKVNLFLRVLARDEGAFHSIETLFCLLDLADELVIERTEESGVALDVNGTFPGLGAPEDNLATRAAAMVLEATGNRFGVRVRLTKRIPVAAGLGGGSSDAAATLLAVNVLADQAVPRHELLQFAARLGSDVPFFLLGTPLALAWGRGERLFRLPGLPAAPGLVLCPPLMISTGEAYGWIDEARQGGGAGRRGGLALGQQAVSTWGDVARMSGNDFETPVFERRPAIRAAFEALAGTRPFMCRLSGSGSALFALYRNPAAADEARLTLGTKHGSVLPVSTLAGPPAEPRTAGR